MITLHKIKSHTKIINIGVDIKHEDRAGNALADHWAGIAADAVQPSEQETNIRSLIDSDVWRVQSRLIAVCQKYLPKVVRKEPDTSIRISGEARLIERFEALGHIPVKHENGSWRCSLCLCQWSKAITPTTVQTTQCPGPSMWNPSSLQPGHWRAREGIEVYVNGHMIHKTHTVQWYRGIYYCSKCGSYAIRRVDRLKLLCLLRPISNASANRLKNMIESKHPRKNGVFPTEQDALPPI